MRLNNHLVDYLVETLFNHFRGTYLSLVIFIRFTPINDGINYTMYTIKFILTHIDIAQMYMNLYLCIYIFLIYSLN